MVIATLIFAEYVFDEREVKGEKKKQRIWKRVPRGPVSVEVPLDPKKVALGARLSQLPALS